MAGGISFIHWGGVVSCVFGGALYLIAVVKGRRASELSTAIKLDRLSDLRDLVHFVPLLVAVTGRVVSDSPLQCTTTTESAVIAEVRETRQSLKQVESGDWVRENHLVRHNVREAPWSLEDGTKVRLPVVNGQQAEGDFLQLVGDNFTPASRSTARDTVADLLRGVRVIGARECERILPLGTPLTAIGQLACQVDGATAPRAAVRTGTNSILVLQAPASGHPFILSTKALPELIAGLRNSSRSLKVAGVGIGVVGAALVVAKAMRGVLAWHRKRAFRRRMHAAAERSAEAGAGQDGVGNGDSSERSCVVCLQADSDMIFPGCGHLCVCQRCGPQCDKCPICRSRMRAIRVYRI